MKRGQLMAQPFVMIFAIIIGALVLIFGMYQIVKISDFSGDVQLKENINQFQRVVDQYYYFNEGSSREYSIVLPSKFDKICFYSGELMWDSSDQDLNRGFIESREDNVFIFPIGEESVFTVENMKPEDNNPLCFRSGEKFIITSKGDYVGVSRI